MENTLLKRVETIVNHVKLLEYQLHSNDNVKNYQDNFAILNKLVKQTKYSKDTGITKQLLGYRFGNFLRESDAFGMYYTTTTTDSVEYNGNEYHHRQKSRLDKLSDC